MSRGTAKKASELDVQPQLIFDAKRDINPFWRSSLFSDVYLKNDVPREYKHLWENDEIGGFYNFYQGFVDLCVDTEHECFEKWREADTVKNWIVPVMELLGWENNAERRQNSYMDNESFTMLENGRKQTYRPDLLYFDKPKHKSYTQKEKDIERKISEAKDSRTGAKIVVEAKYWDRLSQINLSAKKESKEGDSASALGPELQTLKYMEMFEHNFGFLTDGKTWRLFHSELSQGMDCRSFDFDLGNLRELALDLGSYQNEEKFSHFAKYFYYFFSKESLIQSEESKTAPFVQEVFEYSKKYAHSIEEDLKKRFIVTMGVTCNALKNSCEEQGEDIDLETIRNVSESHLFNILFVKSCEVRRVLPISSTQYLRVSLHEVVESLDAMGYDPDKDRDDYLRDFKFTFGKKFDWEGFDIFNRFINLYEIIHDGTAKSKKFGFEVEGFKESIFTKSEWKFAKKHKINNKDMVDIIFNLSFIESSFTGRKYQQIPYSYFTPRQLGSIYESLLEFKLEKSEEDMVFTGGQWKPGNLKSRKVKDLKLIDQFKVVEGDLFFSPDNSERKMSGSFYTPDYVVKYISEKILNESIEEMTSSDLLKLKICDPAMGSAHFLSGIIDLLVSMYRSKWSDENNDDLEETTSETSRRILDSCIYGVDINPRAVKLGKMSLWLLTATPGKKLERLDDQICSGDSLSLSKTFNWKKTFPKVFKGNKGFDYVIGNPPWGAKLTNDERETLANIYPDVSHGCRDTFKFFSALAFNILKPNGFFGFIIPSTFIVQPKYKDLKTFFLSKKIIEIVSMGDGVFGAEVSAPCAITIIQNNDEGTKELKVRDISSDKDKEKSLNSQDSGNSVELDISDSKNTYSFEAIVLAKDCGIKHQRNGCGLENKGKSDLPQRLYYSGKKEGKSDELYLIGKDLSKTGFFFSKPKDRYFRGNYKSILKKNETVYFNKDVMGVKRKLLWRQTADRPICGISDKTYFANTLQCGQLTDEAISLGVTYEFVCCLMNSSVFRYLYLTKVLEQGRVFPQVKLSYLREMPIRIGTEKDIEKITSLYEKVMAEDTKSLVTIDDYFFKLYGVSSQEKKTILETLTKNKKELLAAA